MSKDRNIEALYHLSPMQQGMLFHLQYAPEAGAYLRQLSWPIEAAVDGAALREAWRRVVDRHPILRSAFLWDGKSDPVQVVRREVDLPWEEHDWRELAPAEREERLEALLRRDREEPFQLKKAPVMRLSLVRLGEASWHLAWSYPQLLLDGWSRAAVLREVMLFYNALASGRELRLERPRPFRDYIAWLRKQDLSQAESFWRQFLQGFTEPTPLPFDDESALEPGHGDIELRLPPEATARVQALARAHRLTLNTLVQGAWSLLLSRYSGEPEVLFGVTVSGRPADLPGVESMVGLFINTLPLRVEVPPGEPLIDWLRWLQDRQSEIRQFEYTPLVEVQSWSEIPRGRALFDSILVFENYMAERVAEEDQLGVGAVRSVEWAGYPLILVAVPGERLLLRAAYDRERFQETTVRRLLAHLQSLLESFAAEPGQRLGDAWFLGEVERHQLLWEWNDTRLPGGGEELALHCFERQVARAPGSTALIRDGRSFTYGELSLRAGRLAARLRDMGVGPDAVVAITADRSVSWIVGLLAVAKAGGAYLSLDLTHPADRLRHQVEDSGARVLLATTATVGDWAPPGARVLSPADDEAAEADGIVPSPGGEPESLAYLIYTSGSTGHPKGVMVAQRGLVNLVAAQRILEVGPESRVLQLAAPSFDASVWEIWMTLATGAALCLAERDALLPGPGLCRLLREQGITHLTITPSALAALPVEDFPALRVLCVAGEAFPADLARQWAQPGRRLYNLYGPTESTIWATFEEVYGDEERLLIGRPILNTRIQIVDASFQPLPIGAVGELLLGGPGLARGYARRPGLTAERFIPDSLSPVPGERLYRTGDRARHLPDGRLDFLGRVDAQVKIRGVRIELEEIEAALRLHSEIREAAVIVAEIGERLVACVTPSGAPPASVLRPWLAERLPESMLPAVYLRLDELPRTLGGKLDRRALVHAAAAAQEKGGSEAPRTLVEEVLAGIWEDVLRMGSPVGIQDDFFERGGHSLLATRVVTRVEEALGVELPIRAVFEAPTLEALAARIEAVMASPGLRAPAIAPVPRDRDLPLSFAQQRLWFLYQMEPESPAYNIPVALRLTGDLDRALLEASLGEVVRRHEVLRTTFEARAGGAVQLIAPPVPAALPLADLGGLPAAVREAEARRLAREEAGRPVDLARGPVLRASLLRLGPSEHAFLGTLHHIAGDGWSIGILVRELAALYGALLEGRPSPLSELPVQYADFAVWQREWLREEVLAGLLAYWTRELGPSPAMLELPADRPRPAVQTFRGSYRRLELPADLSRAVHDLSRSESTTPFMTLLAAFAVQLGRSTGQEDVVLGTPIAGRNRAETEGLIGFFINTLALRLDLAGDPTFRQLAARSREASLGAYAHQDLPFERLVEELRLGRDRSRHPLFQVMLVLQNLPSQSFELPVLQLHPFAVEGETAKLDLTLSLSTGAERITGALSYNTDLFDAATAERLLAHFRTLLEGAVRNPQARISELPLLSAAERHQLLVEWGESSGPAVPLRPVHELFAAQARRAPEAPALVFPGGSLSYGELDARADRLAVRLAVRGVTPGTLVAVGVDRTAEMIVALLGILKAGGAYVPLDPSYPSQRLEAMLSDSGATLLVTRSGLAELLPGSGLPVMLLEDEDGPAAGPHTHPEKEVALDSPAYLVYTSGSTGLPKGILVSHRALASRIVSLAEAYGLGPGRRMLQFLSLSFDAVGEEIYPVLVSGGALVLLGDPAAIPAGELLDRAGELGADCFHVPPSYWYQILEHLETNGRSVPEHVGLFITGGESSSVEKLAAWRRATRHPSRFCNAYGPSEATITATMYEVPHDAGTVARFSRLPVGRVLPGSSASVLGPDGDPLPIGVPGELYLGGCLADGYLGRPDLTAEKFVPDPFGRRRGERLYRTGDLVRWRADGNLDLLGRIDQQVQVRGLRVELGEIEDALLRFPGVRQAAVVARENGAGARLVGYLAIEGKAPALGELRQHLKERLPEHMVPASMVLLDSLPVTPNGKVDRRALPESGGERLELETSFVAARNPVEESLAAIWRDVLGLERVGVYDNFFELGGDSIRTIQIISRARQAGLGLEPKALFEHQTIAGLAEAAGGRLPLEETGPQTEAPGEAPTDFPLAGIDQKKLDRLMSKYNRPSGQ